MTVQAALCDVCFKEASEPLRRGKRDNRPALAWQGELDRFSRAQQQPKIAQHINLMIGFFLFVCHKMGQTLHGTPAPLTPRWTRHFVYVRRIPMCMGRSAQHVAKTVAGHRGAARRLCYV